MTMKNIERKYRNKSGIYKILNTKVNKFYIGSAASLYDRCKHHKSYLNLNKHSNAHLQNAWNKYGADAFEFVVLEYCDKSKLIDREQYYLDTLKPEYNIRTTAKNNTGLKHTEEFKFNASIRQSSRFISDETKFKISQSLKDFYFDPQKLIAPNTEGQ